MAPTCCACRAVRSESVPGPEIRAHPRRDRRAGDRCGGRHPRRGVRGRRDTWRLRAAPVAQSDLNPYLVLKYAHILVAIVALGTGVAVGILVAVFADDVTHGAYVLRLSRRLLHVVVLPRDLLLVLTGMWMGHLADLLDAHWA